MHFTDNDIESHDDKSVPQATQLSCSATNIHRRHTGTASIDVPDTRGAAISDGSSDSDTDRHGPRRNPDCATNSNGALYKDTDRGVLPHAPTISRVANDIGESDGDVFDQSSDVTCKTVSIDSKMMPFHSEISDVDASVSDVDNNNLNSNNNDNNVVNNNNMAYDSDMRLPQTTTCLREGTAYLSRNDSLTYNAAVSYDAYNQDMNNAITHLPYAIHSTESSVSYDTESIVINVTDEFHADNAHPGVTCGVYTPGDVDGQELVEQPAPYQRRNSMHRLSPVSLIDTDFTGSTDFSRYCPSSNLHFHPSYVHKKSVCVTYILALFLGLVGGHHFYLNRPKFGTVYVFTAGLLGIGYIVDLIRVPWLVENANLEIMHPELKGKRSTADAYLLWIPPFGLLGFHHFYLKNWFIAVIYLLTGGGLLLGWLSDLLLLSVHWLPIANAHTRSILQYSTSDTPIQDRRYPASHVSVCEIMSADDIHDTSVDQWGYPSDFVSELPSYSEVDELGPDPYSPPPYCEVITLGHPTCTYTTPTDGIRDTPSTYV